MPGVQTRVSLSWGGQSHSGHQASIPASPHVSLRVPEDTGALLYLHPSFQPLSSSKVISLLHPVLRLLGASIWKTISKMSGQPTLWWFYVLSSQGPKESSNDEPVNVLIGWWADISGHVMLSEFSIRSYGIALSLQRRRHGCAAAFCSSPLPVYLHSSSG